MTINCARCHLHKFDPITQREYYSFVANITGVTPGDRDTTLPGGEGDVKQKIDTFNAKRRPLVNSIKNIDQVARASILAKREKGDAPKPVLPNPIGRWEFDGDLKDGIGKADGQSFGGAKVVNGVLVLDGRDDFVKTGILPFDLREKTLETWVKLANLNQRGGGAMTVQTPGGGVFDSIVFGEREAKRWMAGSNSFARYQSFKAPA